MKNEIRQCWKKIIRQQICNGIRMRFILVMPRCSRSSCGWIWLRLRMRTVTAVQIVDNNGCDQELKDVVVAAWCETWASVQRFCVYVVNSIWFFKCPVFFHFFLKKDFHIVFFSSLNVSFALVSVILFLVLPATWSKWMTDSHFTMVYVEPSQCLAPAWVWTIQTPKNCWKIFIVSYRHNNSFGIFSCNFCFNIKFSIFFVIYFDGVMMTLHIIPLHSLLHRCRFALSIVMTCLMIYVYTSPRSSLNQNI